MSKAQKKQEEKPAPKQPTVAERVIRIVVDEFGLKEDDVELDSNFVDDLGADSLDLVELMMSLEEEFEKEGLAGIPDEDAEKITTVKKAIDYVERHITQSKV